MNLNWCAKVVCEEFSKQLAKRLPAGTGPASSLAFESLQKSCDMYDLRWPHCDRESISEGEAVKGVFLVTCI